MTYPALRPRIRSIGLGLAALLLAGCTQSFIDDLDRGS